MCRIRVVPFLLVAAAAGTCLAGEGFVLRDVAGRTWRNELVTFPLDAAALARARAGRALVGPGGGAVLHQIVPAAAGQPARIAFLADLDPFETRTYRLADAPSPARTDLKVEQTAERIRISNGRTGVSIARRLAAGAGCVEGIRTASGQWVGGSRLPGPAPRRYEAKVTARGPVFVEVVCEAEFDGGGAWRVTFRLQAEEPVIVVDESFSAGRDRSWALLPGRGWHAGEVLFRYGKSGPDGRCGKTATWKIAPDPAEPAFVLEPWLHWWERVRQGTWFALYGRRGGDALAIGAVRADLWVAPPVAGNPASAPAPRPEAPKLLLTGAGADLALTFPLAGGRRRWLIAALDTDACLAPIRQGKPYQAPLPQQYFIKHGDFPLERVKDYVLDWPAGPDSYPRLYVTAKDLARLRRSVKVDPKQLARYRTAPVSPYNMGGPVAYYLATGDAALGKHLAETAVAWVQAAVDMYLKQGSLVTLGFAPHHQTSVLTSIILADAVLDDRSLSPDLRRRLRGQIALLGYTVSRADYWSPPRGFSANPNMTTTVAAYQCAAACVIPSHPKARAWARAALAELKDNQLDRWSDANGGWLEAPHYAMVSYDYLVGCFLMARNAGFADYLYDPRMKKVAQWLGKISTPPDSRLAGRRHLPCIGNTYVCEPTGEFGVLAGLWKDKDPRFASEMQWLHRQHGRRADPGIGGFFPTLAGYRALLADDTISPRAPAYGSEWFPRTGLVLRNRYPSDRETYLHLIAGSNHDHYDRDSGSIVLYGKGRLLANDFGYYGYVTGEDHSMVVSPAAPDAGIMHVRQFSPSPGLDYVRAAKQAWTRQIAFVKDADVLGPNYFVLRDSLRPPAKADWRLYCSAAEVKVQGQQLLAVGKEDVDMDVVFLRPAGGRIKTAAVSRSTWGLDTKVRYGRVTTTQTGVTLALGKGEECLAVLYPRLKSHKPPHVTALAGGKAVKVQGAWGTDYVFLGTERFAFSEGGVTFDGSAGAAAIRGEHLTLSLAAAGRIAAKGKTLDSKGPACRQWPETRP